MYPGDAQFGDVTDEDIHVLEVYEAHSQVHNPLRPFRQLLGIENLEGYPLNAYGNDSGHIPLLPVSYSQLVSHLFAKRAQDV